MKKKTQLYQTRLGWFSVTGCGSIWPKKWSCFLQISQFRLNHLTTQAENSKHSCACSCDCCQNNKKRNCWLSHSVFFFFIYSRKSKHFLGQLTPNMKQQPKFLPNTFSTNIKASGDFFSAWMEMTKWNQTVSKANVLVWAEKCGWHTADLRSTLSLVLKRKWQCRTLRWMSTAFNWLGSERAFYNPNMGSFGIYNIPQLHDIKVSDLSALVFFTDHNQKYMLTFIYCRISHHNGICCLSFVLISAPVVISPPSVKVYFIFFREVMMTRWLLSLVTLLMCFFL